MILQNGITQESLGVRIALRKRTVNLYTHNITCVYKIVNRFLKESGIVLSDG
jgi:hypothetical protein